MRLKPLSLLFTAILVFTISIANGQTPTISSFSPTSGPVGTVVKIIGTDLENTTSVTVGGIPALIIAAKSNQIDIMVMPESITGIISVINSSVTTNSSSSFTITQAVLNFNNLNGSLVKQSEYRGNNVFAKATALSANGKTAVISIGSSRYLGFKSVLVFERVANNWIRQADLMSSINTSDNMGLDVAVSGNGDVVVVGDGNQNGAWVFSRDINGIWSQQGSKLVASSSSIRGSWFQSAQGGLQVYTTVGGNPGTTVAVSADGNTIALGAPGENPYGGVWIFTKNANTWSQQGGKLEGTNTIISAGYNNDLYYQGGAIALSADGNTLVSAASVDNANRGAIWVFNRIGNTWTQQGSKISPAELIPFHIFGSSVSINADGNTIAVGATGDFYGEGTTFVFQRNAGVWSQDGAKLKGYSPSGYPRQGRTVSLRADGKGLLVGGPSDNDQKGAIWYFKRGVSNWQQVGNKIYHNDLADSAFLGATLTFASDGQSLLAGSPNLNHFINREKTKNVWYWGNTTVSSGIGRLTNLNVNDSILSPVFNPNTLGYFISLIDTIQSISITPTAEDPDATIVVQNTNYPYSATYSIASGGTIPSVAIYPGLENYIKVYVTSSDKRVTWEYQIRVHRISTYSNNVSSGVTGGLESKSLGGAIVKRVYNKAVKNQNGTLDYKNLEIVNTKPEERIKSLSNSGTTKLSLASVMPELNINGFVAYYSSPVDIVSFTNAKEVLAIDYTLNKQNKAVAFATQTNGFIYDHTKPVCDRLKGASIKRLDKLNIYGADFIKYTILNEKGQTEFATSFSFGAKTGSSEFTLQSNWLSTEYIGEETMYNFQLWASSPDLLDSLVTSVINKVQKYGQIRVIAEPKLPRSFILSGKREGSKLNLKLTNADALKNGYFTFEDKLNESSISTIKRNIPFTLTANGETTISIPVSDTYESTISMFVDGEMKDVIYMTDGTWYADYNQATSSISSFVVSNEANRIIAENELPIFRNVSIKAKSPDFITVLKTLKGGGIETDLSDYKGLKFTGIGGQNLRITLVKNSVANWDNQYSFRLKLDQEKKEYFVSFDKFKSKSTLSSIKPDDITAVLFTFEVESGINTNLSNELSQLSFTKTDLSYLASLDEKEINIFPNPASNKFYASFKSPKEVKLNLVVRDAASGKVIYSKWINAIKGENTVSVDLKNTIGMNNYILNLEGTDIKYQSKKVIVTQ